MYNAALEGELEATKQAKEKEKEHYEAQLAQQQESARRTQDKLQVENSVSSLNSKILSFPWPTLTLPHPSSR